MDSRREKYLDNIVEHLVNATKYDTDHLNLYIIKFPFSEGWEVFGSHREMSDIYDISPERFGIKRWDFDQEMINVFDLMEHESDYVWEEYFKGARFFGNEYANSDGLINESMEDKQKEFLDKVVSRLINETEIDNDKREMYIPFSVDNTIALSIDYILLPHIDKYPPFIRHCKNIYGLTNEECDYAWRQYKKNIKGKCAENHKKKPWYNFLIGSAYGINESIEDKQKDYLDYVYNDLVKNTKFRDASYRDIDLYDGKCKSLQIGIRWGSEAPYFNYVPDCLENYLKDYWGLTYNEIQELFWDKYEQHIINMVLSKKEHVSPHVRVHVDYLRESKIDKQTDFLKKVVDTMIDETIPYNLSKGSVITPFVADKNNNGKYILSAHYCKNMLDYFEDEFTLGNIFINYLEMFGLSYEEMLEVMYSYFNVLFEKYFKRFFDLSYKTRPRLDESVDFGFIDKVTDRVLNEIVWDFDRGLVHFPMINYSSGIRDDGFLSAVVADDAFTKDISAPNTNWHVDLMKHIEDTYAITGSEWNSVWGSLQGEIWEKTEEYWDSFTRGY